jgi:hypothetical protein
LISYAGFLPLSCLVSNLFPSADLCLSVAVCFRCSSYLSATLTLCRCYVVPCFSFSSPILEQFHARGWLLPHRAREWFCTSSVVPCCPCVVPILCQCLLCCSSVCQTCLLCSFSSLSYVVVMCVLCVFLASPMCFCCSIVFYVSHVFPIACAYVFHLCLCLGCVFVICLLLPSVCPSYIVSMLAPLVSFVVPVIVLFAVHVRLMCLLNLYIASPLFVMFLKRVCYDLNMPFLLICL